MTLDYKKITLEDKATITSFTLKSDRQNCDLSFSNLCSWSFMYHTEFAVAEGFLVLRFQSEGKPVYMMPVGEGDLPGIIRRLIDESREAGYPFRMYGVCKQHLSLLEEAIPEVIEFTTDRDSYDYIYLREDLVALRGKRFQAKRNHINKFLKTYPDWSYSPITPDQVSECLDMEQEWCIANDCEQHEGLGLERKAIVFALRHFDELGLTGGILRTRGKIVAFTFGMPINENTFGVHVEKADSDIEGAYAMTNQQFAQNSPANYTYINREEDLGIEGLRKAKLSYHPTLLLEKYMAKLKEQS